MATANDVGKGTERREHCAASGMSGAQANAVAFGCGRTETVLLTRPRMQFPRMKIWVNGQGIAYNKEATRWLGVSLACQLTLKQPKRHRLGLARNVEAQVRSLMGKLGLTSANFRRIQIAAVPAVARYGAGLWWNG
jgi:hypothetical protein